MKNTNTREEHGILKYFLEKLFNRDINSKEDIKQLNSEIYELNLKQEDVNSIIELKGYNNLLYNNLVSKEYHRNGEHFVEIVTYISNDHDDHYIIHSIMIKDGGHYNFISIITYKLVIGEEIQIIPNLDELPLFISGNTNRLNHIIIDETI